MPMMEIDQGTILCESGKQLKNLYLIMKGTVSASYHGGSFLLRAGDVVGLCEVNRENTHLQYQVEDKISVIPYAASLGDLKRLLESNTEAVKYFLSSAFKQLNEISRRCHALRTETEEAFHYLKDGYEAYVSLCESKNISPGVLTGYEEMQAPAFEGRMPEWLSGYYATLEQMLAIWDHNKTDYDFIWGFLLKAGEDVAQLLLLCGQMQDYKEELSELFLNESGLDLFGLYSGLYLEEVEENGFAGEAAMKLKMKVSEMQAYIQQQKMGDISFCQRRWQEFEKNVKALENGKGDEETGGQELKNQMEELVGSLDKILKYAECGEQVEASFRKYLLAYKKLANKNGSEDVARLLRRELTSLFYKIYIAAFQVSVKDKEIPMVVRMFFDFGYIDEELAGIKNALYLYQIESNMPTAPDKGVYSMYQWLLAVYTGQKEPGRNEFDLDYVEYLREQKKQGKITAQQEASLVNSQASKVMYELENVFPSVNKVTYGRPSTFCPLFSKHNILKPLNTALVTAEKIEQVLLEIRQKDFGAFYRETMYAEPDKGVPREEISVEVLPDVILTPNIGARGILWQEIEGKKRTTPARMMCSIFQIEDLSLTMMRLTAEFRWEMCKRIQGARWNDVSERSLTSEYCDYVQFYRKNKELSAETKDKIKVQLGKAKNNFKEMFISDYIMWLCYESIGSPRLNKIVRSIFFTYCPFPKEVREKLAVNPLYKEFSERYKVKMGQRVHHIDILCQKLRNSGKSVPEEIEEYKQFLEM